MKRLLFFIILYCVTISSQEKNKQILDEKSNKQILIGICDQSAFIDTSYSWWFNAEYDNYSVDSSAFVRIKKNPFDYSITIVMGTWCSDSRREVPRFYKILDFINFDKNKLTLICVNREKQSTDGDMERYDIKFVPTFIFNKNGNEIGRIIETPKNKLEEDFAELISK